MKRFLKLQLPKELHSFAVATGGAFGALSRAGIESVVSSNILSVLICNLIGTFTLSAAISFRARPLSEIENLISIGFCGGFSIFATFSKVSVRLLEQGEYMYFAINGAANFILCVWAVYLAEAMMTKLFPKRGDALNDNMMKAEMKRQATGKEQLRENESEINQSEQVQKETSNNESDTVEKSTPTDLDSGKISAENPINKTDK